MKLRCILGRHDRGDEQYMVKSWLYARHSNAVEFRGDVSLAFCGDCHVARYNWVAMSRALSANVSSTTQNEITPREGENP